MVRYSEEQKNCKHDFSVSIADSLERRIGAIQTEFHIDVKHYCPKCRICIKPSLFPDLMTAREIAGQYEQALWILAEKHVQNVK